MMVSVTIFYLDKLLTSTALNVALLIVEDERQSYFFIKFTEC